MHAVGRLSSIFSPARIQIAAALLSVGVALCLPLSAQALSALGDDEMSNVQGEGIALVLENIRAQMGPQSYIQETGSAPTGGTTLQRGDYRWYGWSMSGTGVGTSWSGAACVITGLGGELGCPIGNAASATGGVAGSIANMAAYDNPYVLRVYQYSAPDMNNNLSVPNTVFELIGPTCFKGPSGPTAVGSNGGGCATAQQTPTDRYRWSFWGEVKVNNDSTRIMKSESIIEGVPAAYLYPTMVAGTAGTAGRPNMYQGTVTRIFRTLADTVATGNPDNATFGMTYASALSGDFRFSVNQLGTAAQTGTSTACGNGAAGGEGCIPTFDDNEGFYFKNVQAYLPLGQLNYQSIVFNTTPANDGNFIIELTQLPNQANAYSNFYSLENSTNENAACATGSSTANQCGYYTAFDAMSSSNWTNVPSTYYQTHGYIQWGDGTSVTGCGTGTATTTSCVVNPTAANCTTTPTSACTSNGIFFVSGGRNTGTADTFTVSATSADASPAHPTYTTTGQTSVNLGTASIQGLLLQHLKITTLGAN